VICGTERQHAAIQAPATATCPRTRSRDGGGRAAVEGQKARGDCSPGYSYPALSRGTTRALTSREEPHETRRSEALVRHASCVPGNLLVRSCNRSHPLLDAKVIGQDLGRDGPIPHPKTRRSVDEETMAAAAIGDDTGDSPPQGTDGRCGQAAQLDLGRATCSHEVVAAALPTACVARSSPMLSDFVAG